MAWEKDAQLHYALRTTPRTTHYAPPVCPPKTGVLAKRVVTSSVGSLLDVIRKSWTLHVVIQSKYVVGLKPTISLRTSCLVNSLEHCHAYQSMRRGARSDEVYQQRHRLRTKLKPRQRPNLTTGYPISRLCRLHVGHRKLRSWNCNASWILNPSVHYIIFQLNTLSSNLKCCIAS